MAKRIALSNYKTSAGLWQRFKYSVKEIDKCCYINYCFPFVVKKRIIKSFLFGTENVISNGDTLALSNLNV